MNRSVKRSLKTRLLLMVASLLLAIFGAILLLFNVLISQYIETNAEEVLTQSRSFLPSSSRDGNPLDRAPRVQTAAGVAERIMVSSDYRILSPDFYEQADENSSLYDFSQAVLQRKIDLNTAQILKLETGQGLYYYTSIANSSPSGGYLVFFISMSNLYKFEQNLSQMLMFILLPALALSLILTWLIATRIANPVRELGLFARRIGEGDYKPLDKEFSDREVEELKIAMNETSDKLQTYDTEQKVFFQNASHELRTPLQIIKTNAEAMEYQLVSPEKAARIIKTEVDGLGELVEDILILSRLDTKSREIVREEGDLRETLSYTAGRFHSVLIEKGLTVQYDFENEPVLFRYDERSMQRAFQNLLSNAVRYAKTAIRITCRTGDHRILIRISDDGPGISSTDLPKIFDRFYKGQNGGHGIGLSIVKSIITSYGGRVDVTTGPEGTDFTVILPASGPAK